MKFQVHTIDTAPEAAKPELRTAKSAFGFLPNLLGLLAEDPDAQAFSTLKTGTCEIPILLNTTWPGMDNWPCSCPLVMPA